MTAQSPKTVDRAALRAEWEAMRTDFHALVDTLTDSQWRQPSVSTGWTNGELLTHFVISIGLLPRQVDSARKGANLGNMPGGLLHTGSYWLTRLTAMRLKRDGLKQRFERDYAAGLLLLDGIHDDEWSKGAEFFGSGFWDMETVCRRPVEHWREHGAQVRLAAKN
ncbi:MAG: maleylpyruvate isomerase N-terminal domain-containing protein [Chloroflexi bacterium]|nr:maleylpyruvate isomerase N-terminal domain-containing protein [Chloroflexota bacterium]